MFALALGDSQGVMHLARLAGLRSLALWQLEEVRRLDQLAQLLLIRLGQRIQLDAARFGQARKKCRAAVFLDRNSHGCSSPPRRFVRR
ncbi:hypothetical protein AO260_08060 [Pseudomonas sp. ABAC21]|nr:hypothetical protein AO260_08060 [Pseudomonas sp. ABAC21]